MQPGCPDVPSTGRQIERVGKHLFRSKKSCKRPKLVGVCWFLAMCLLCLPILVCVVVDHDQPLGDDDHDDDITQKMETAAYHHHDHRRQVAERDQQQHKPKWEGKASTLLKTCKPQQVWPLLEDFFGLNTWFPILSICLPVEGTWEQPGCIRYRAGFKTAIDNHKYNNVGSEKKRVSWTKQKLLSIDPARMGFSYSIVDYGNVGFNSYVSTVKVVPAEEDGCIIDWWYEVAPVEGWKPQDLDGFIGRGLQLMATRMEEALQAYNEVTKP